MRHIAHEIAAHLLGLHNPRDVAHKKQEIAAREGGDLELQNQARVGRVGHLQGLLKLALQEVLVKRRPAQQIEHGLAAIAGILKAQKALRCRVRPLDGPALGEDEHAVAHGRKGTAQIIDGGLQAPAGLAVFALQAVDRVVDQPPDSGALRRGVLGALQPAAHAPDLPQPVAAHRGQTQTQHLDREPRRPAEGRRGGQDQQQFAQFSPPTAGQTHPVNTPREENR